MIVFLKVLGLYFQIIKLGLVRKIYQDIHYNIHVVVNNITLELLAKSHNKKAIKLFTLIKVIKIIDH